MQVMATMRHKVGTARRQRKVTTLRSVLGDLMLAQRLRLGRIEVLLASTS